MNEADRVANFKRIEGIVKSGAIDSLPIADVRKERDSLLRDSPNLYSTQFGQRWERVNMAISARLDGEFAWWQKPWGTIAIGVASAIIGAAATKLLGLTQ